MKLLRIATKTYVIDRNGVVRFTIHGKNAHVKHAPIKKPVPVPAKS